MKHLKFILIIILLFSFSFISAEKNKKNISDNSNTITWYSYDEGLKKAKEENKQVFIDFKTGWCGYCKKMDREAFVDSAIVNMLNTQFVAVQVDGDSRKELDVEGYKITERDLTRKEFGVSSYPTFFWLESDGSKIGNKIGYVPKEWMLGALNFVKDRKYDTTKTEQNNQPSEDSN
jgi:thioredoxin-related protein